MHLQHHQRLWAGAWQGAPRGLDPREAPTKVPPAPASPTPQVQMSWNLQASAHHSDRNLMNLAKRHQITPEAEDKDHTPTKMVDLTLPMWPGHTQPGWWL